MHGEHLHNIIQSHNSVQPDWQYYVKYSSHLVLMWKYFAEFVSPAEYCYGSE